MSVPKSVTKIKNGNVEYTSSVEWAKYSIKELIRAALRDTGKYVCNRFRASYYGVFKRKKGNVARYTQYWVRSKQDTPDLQVGLKPNAFYGGFQEFGSSKTSKFGLLYSSVENNIETIADIQSQYLSAMNSDDPSSSFGDEGDMEGGGDE